MSTKLIQALGSYHGHILIHTNKQTIVFVISKWEDIWLACLLIPLWFVCDCRMRARTWCCFWATTAWKSCRWSLRCSWTSRRPRPRPAASTPAPSSTSTTTIGQFYSTRSEIRKENLCTQRNNDISIGEYVLNELKRNLCEMQLF